MELLVRTFDKYTGEDVRLQSKNTRRGDVIAVQPDGAYWGPCEVKNPAYVILRVPVSETEARAMLTPELGDPLAKPLLHVREFHIDLDALALLGYRIPNPKEAREARYPNGKDIQDYLNLPDSPVIEVQSVDFQSSRARKKPLTDPMVIG